MKNPAKTFAQIGLPERAPGRFGRVFGIGKAGSGLDTVDAGGSPRDRAALTSARSRTSPHASISVDVSLFHLQRGNRVIIAGGLCTYRPPAIETHRRERRRGSGFSAGRYYPRSAREFATCGGSRAPPRCVPPTRLFKSKQKRVRKGDDTGSRWIQTLSYNSRNGGTLLTLFADCRLVSRIFSPRSLCVARCFGKNLGAPFRLRGCPWKFTTHTRDLTVVARRSPSAVRGVNTRVRILRVTVRTAGRRAGDAGPAGGEREARGGNHRW